MGVLGNGIRIYGYNWPSVRYATNHTATLLCSSAHATSSMLPWVALMYIPCTLESSWRFSAVAVVSVIHHLYLDAANAPSPMRSNNSCSGRVASRPTLVSSFASQMIFELKISSPLLRASVVAAEMVLAGSV